MSRKITLSIREKMRKNDVQFRNFLTILYRKSMSEEDLANYLNYECNSLFPRYNFKFTKDLIIQLLNYETHYIGFGDFLTDYNMPCIYVDIEVQ
jgi:hypothetical protein